MEDRILNGKLAIAKFIYAGGGVCVGIDCLRNQKYDGAPCPVFETLKPGEICRGTEQAFLAALDFINIKYKQAVQENGDSTGVKVLEHLLNNEGVCDGIPCQACPIFDRCECDSRSQIISAASLALDEIRNNDRAKYRNVRWVSEKSGKVLTGLLVAEVSGMAIVVSKKDASRVVSISMEKLI